jgi:hypothetical protein
MQTRASTHTDSDTGADAAATASVEVAREGDGVMRSGTGIEEVEAEAAATGQALFEVAELRREVVSVLGTRCSTLLGSDYTAPS